MSRQKTFPECVREIQIVASYFVVFNGDINMCEEISNDGLL